VAAASDDSRATRDQLLTRTHLQQAELNQLRARVAQLEKTAGDPEGLAIDTPEPGRLWHDPSHDKLVEWAAQCHIRSDEPGLTRFNPVKRAGDDRMGLEPEVDAANATMTELSKQWQVCARLRRTAGDAPGGESLSTEACAARSRRRPRPASTRSCCRRSRASAPAYRHRPRT
jgi:hypothetical protein